jgi:hypothetical protein
MRKTVLCLASISLGALLLSHCNNEQTGGNPPVDMSVATEDMTTPSPDLSDPPDMASQPPTPTTFTVVRVGTGTAALNNDATATFLERRQLADGTLVGNALAMPVAASGSNRPLTLSGLASVEGQLSRSADGKYLILGGYAAAPGSRDISTSSSATYNRVIGRIDAAGNINTATASTAFTAAAVRGATSSDGNMLWISSDSGIGYTTLNSTAVPVILNISNVRALGIFGSGTGAQLYVSSSAGSNLGMNSVGTGLPTTMGTAVTRLTGFTDSNSPATVGFVVFDRDNNGSPDQMYVADSRTVAGGGVQRWRLNGTTWMLEGTIPTGANSGARYLDGFVNGTTVTLVVTTNEMTDAIATRVLRLSDAGGATSAVTSMMLSTAANNTTYRGIALSPNP